MKKITLVVLLSLYAVTAFSQSKAFDGQVARRRVIVGIRGGVNFNSFGPDIAKVWNAVDPVKKTHVGWNVGLVFDCPILESLYFQPGVFYKTKGFRLSEVNHGYSRKMQGVGKYLQFPLLFSYRYNIKKGVQAEFNVGPYIGVAVSGSVKDIVYSYLLPPDPDPDPDESSSGGSYNGLNPDYIDTKSPRITTLNYCGSDLESSFGLKKMDYGLCFGAGVTINRFYVGFQYDLGLTNLRNNVCWRDDVRFRTGSATILLGFNLFK